MAVVARKRLGKHILTATNTHATKEEMLEAVFLMRSLSYLIEEQFFQALLALFGVSDRD